MGTEKISRKLSIHLCATFSTSSGQTLVTLAYIFKTFFQIQRRKAHHSDSIFLDEYEYVNHFSAVHPDFPKFYVKGLKITLNGCF